MNWPAMKRKPAPWPVIFAVWLMSICVLIVCVEVLDSNYLRVTTGAIVVLSVFWWLKNWKYIR